MLATEVQDRLPQRWDRPGVTTAVVVVGGEIGQRPITGPGLEVASCQVSDRTDGQIELPGDLRRGGPESGHPGDGEP